MKQKITKCLSRLWTIIEVDIDNLIKYFQNT